MPVSPSISRTPTEVPADSSRFNLQIALPPTDSRKARKMYKQMHEEMDFDPRARLGG